MTTDIRRLWPLAVAGAVFLTLAPLATVMPSEGLDPSWGLVLERAYLQGEQWGRGIVFTFGPFGFLYQRLFHPDLAAIALAASVLRCGLVAVGITLLLRGSGTTATVLATLAAVTALPTARDNTYLLLPLITVLGHFRAPTPVAREFLVAVAAFCGLAALVKTTFALLALTLFLVVDIDRVARRRPPLLTPVMLTTAGVLYLVAGQEPRNVGLFLSLSLEVAAGFSQAMSLFDGLRALELAGFLAASGAVLALVITAERRGGGLRRRSSVLKLAALAIFWFVTFKAGFTRHDLHTLISWTSLGVAATLVGATSIGQTRVEQPPPGERWPGLLLLAAGLAIAALAPIRMTVPPGPGIARVLMQTLVGNPVATLREAGAIAFSPGAWSRDKAEERLAALEGIRVRNPLPALSGSIDTVPSIQAAVIAAEQAGGATYRPRPVFQEYSTYTPRLIEANRAALTGETAADTLLLAPGSIDDRYPSLAEGPLWPDILHRYAPVGLAGPVDHLNQPTDILILRRRHEGGHDDERGPALGPVLSLSAGIGDDVDLALGAAPLFATIDVRLSSPGRVLALLHQAPTVTATVTLADGSHRTHRLIADIARAGFLLSPYLSDARDVARLLAEGSTGLPGARVSSIRVDVPDAASWLYDPTVEITIRTLSLGSR